MRVIAGEMKGRQLKAVPGMNTRPTSDKIKEAIFHKIGPFFDGGSCLDLFAGSGSLGIEAISRGMDKAILIDKSGQAIQTIYKNIELLGITNKIEVYRNDAIRALDILERKGRQFELIMLDPPYEQVNYNDLLGKLVTSNILLAGGIIYCEHGAKLQPVIENQSFEIIYTKVYNRTTAITLFRKNT